MRTVEFSVLIATRNRPALFKNAISSVLANEGASYEVIVIDDGTCSPHREALDELEAALLQQHGERVRFLRLPHKERGHGQSFTLNYGASHARGIYLCFLDDDDCWTDVEHLARAAQIIAASEQPVDLLFFDQAAFKKDLRLVKPIWLEDLGVRLAAEGKPDQHGTYTVRVDQLLTASGHCHVNTTIIRRELFRTIGGFDEAIRYECDRDFYLRAIDRAQLIKYAPRIVARHNVPDPAAGLNMSTIVSDMEKLRYRLSVLDKAAERSAHASLRAHARRHRGYTFKKMALAAHEARSFAEARLYATRGLRDGFSKKWLGVSCYLAARWLLAGCPPK